MKSYAELEPRLRGANATIHKGFGANPCGVAMWILGHATGCIGRLNRQQYKRLVAGFSRLPPDPELLRLQVRALEALRAAHARATMDVRLPMLDELLRGASATIDQCSKENPCGVAFWIMGHATGCIGTLHRSHYEHLLGSVIRRVPDAELMRVQVNALRALRESNALAARLGL